LAQEKNEKNIHPPQGPVSTAELTWWLSDMLFPQRKYGVAIGTSGNTIDVTVGL
jgi:hypothetical protein